MARFLAAAIMVSSHGSVVSAGPPPGFEVVRVTNDSDYESGIGLNNCGQIVYHRKMGSTWAFGEVFVYDNDRTFRLTNNMDRDVGPNISDSGQIVWARGVGSGGASMILHYDHGEVRMLAQNADGVLGPEIANTGHCVWPELLAEGCHGVDTRLQLWDDEHIRTIIQGQGSHQGTYVNNFDELTWTSFDFCVDPWDADIQFHDGEALFRISDENAFQPQGGNLNDSAQVVWSENAEDYQNYVVLWEDGARRVLTDWGDDPMINNHGDVAFYRWHEDLRTFRSWVYWRREFFAIAEDISYNATEDINDYGEVALALDEYPTTDVGLMRRIRTGEADFDGDFDLADHREWARCLDGPDFLERNRTDPTDTLCDCRFLDLDHDNDVDLRDFAGFQNAFAPGG